MSMKKLLALLLAVVMVMSVVACTPKDPTTATDPTNQGTNPTGNEATEPTGPQVVVFEGDYKIGRAHV